MFLANQIDNINQIAVNAGRAIMTYYKEGLEADLKGDKSPVTKADLEANHIIVNGLNKLAPEVPAVSEEFTHNHNTSPNTEYFWLIDPLDGTKSFIRQRGDFTVNIALMQNLRPIWGVIYVPAREELYYTNEKGAWKVDGSGKKQIFASKPNKADGFNFVVSHSHLDPETEKYLTNYKVKGKKSASSSYKFCLIAEGEADIYPRFGPTMEWDIAAGHALVDAAGGMITNLDGSEFEYGKPGFRNPGFIAKTRNV